MDWVLELGTVGEMAGERELERLLMLLWQSWNLQNSAIFQGRKDEPHRMVEWVLHFPSDFRDAYTATKPARPERKETTRWPVPPMGWVAVSVDAATDCVRGKVGA